MKFLFILFCILSFFSAQAFAENLESIHAESAAKKKSIIIKSMALNKDDNNAFLKIYEDYEKELGTIKKDKFKLIQKYSSKYNNDDISEQSATNMLAEIFRYQARESQIKQSYISKFQEVLPKEKVLRFYQIDSQADSLVSSEAIEKLPPIGLIQ